MEHLLAYLNSIYPLSESLVEHLRQIVGRRKIKQGDFLLEAGSISRYLYFIEKGALRCFYLKGKTEVTSWILKETDVVVSVHSFYDQEESFEYIQSLEDTVVFYLSYEELEGIYKEFIEFNFIGRVLTIKYLKFWTMQLYNLRMRTAKERFTLLLADSPELFLRVQQRYLASYLNMLPETFSRMKNR